MAENIDTTTNFGIRNAIQTETAEQMPNDGSTEGCVQRNDFVSVTREYENASHICDNENNIQRSEYELHSEESAREETSISKADCENKTEITRSAQNVIKTETDKEETRETESISGGINREGIVICDKETNVEVNGNMLHSRENTLLNDMNANSVSQYKREPTNRTLTNDQVLNSHGKVVERNNEQVGYNMSKQGNGNNKICENENSGDRHIGSLDSDYKNKSGIHHSSTFTDEGRNESSETCKSYKSECSGETKAKANRDILCYPQSLISQDAGNIGRKEGGTSVICNSAIERQGEEKDSKIRGKKIDNEKHSTSRNLPESHVTDRKETIVNTLNDSRQTQVSKNDICKLDTCNAAKSARAAFMDTQLHVAPSVNGASEKKLRVTTSGNNQQRITQEPKAIEQHSSEITVNGDVNVEVRLEAATTQAEHVSGESSGIVDRVEVFTKVSNRDNKQCSSKIPQRIIAEQETDQQDNLSRKHTKRVTSVSRHDGEGDQHNDLPECGKQQATSSRSHNARSVTNHSLQGYEEQSESRGFCVQNPQSNRKQGRFKSKQQPKKTAVQENSKQSIFTGEHSECVISSSRLHNEQHYQRERQRATGIPFLNATNQDSEADTRQSTSRGGRDYDEGKIGNADTSQRRSKSVTRPRTTTEQESSSQSELAQNHSQSLTHRPDVVVPTSQYEQRERREPAIRSGRQRARRAQDLLAVTRIGRNEDDGDDGGDDDGGGGQEAYRRLFDYRCLMVSIQSRSEFQPNNTVNNIQLGRLELNIGDDNRIKRFFSIKHFPFLFKDQVSNAFVFHIGNRSIFEVIEILNEIKDRLKQLCFARFFGTYVNGREIVNPNDLVIIFGFRVINGHLNDVPSIQMVV